MESFLIYMDDLYKFFIKFFLVLTFETWYAYEFAV